MKRIDIAFRKLRGLPCWNVQRGFGSFLTLEFGEPHLAIREPFESTARSAKVRKLAARRLVSLRGDWHLWIYCCDWSVFEGQDLVGDCSTKQTMDRAAEFLNGQKLIRTGVIARGMRATFEFDLGGRLETRPYDRTSEQWMLYEPGGNVLTVRADMRYSYGSGGRASDRKKWWSMST
jgi:hypothetical protein